MDVPELFFVLRCEPSEDISTLGRCRFDDGLVLGERDVACRALEGCGKMARGGRVEDNVLAISRVRAISFYESGDEACTEVKKGYSLCGSQRVDLFEQGSSGGVAAFGILRWRGRFSELLSCGDAESALSVVERVSGIGLDGVAFFCGESVASRVFVCVGSQL